MNSPEVSIVLPTFNRLQFLRTAVDSVFAQTFPDWELIVADDGSQGETAAYLAELADLPRIKVLRLTHTGNVPAVRNAACREARGEYIAFLDSDDVWLPEKLALQLASLRARPERGWSHTGFAAIEETGERLAGAHVRSWPATQGRALERVICMDIVIAISSVIVTRRLLEQLGGFDDALLVCEDYDLWLRLAASSELDGVDQTLLYKRARRAPEYYDSCMVLEHLGRSLEKLLAANSDRGVRSLARRERSRLAAALALSQAAGGRRRAAVRTLMRSPPYSLRYRVWWRAVIGAGVHAVAPPSTLRVARRLLRRAGAM